MSTRRSARIKKVSIPCNGNAGSVSPDLSEEEDTISVVGVVVVFSNEGEDAEEDVDDDGDGVHSVGSDELEQKLSGKKRYQAPHENFTKKELLRRWNNEKQKVKNLENAKKQQ